MRYCRGVDRADAQLISSSYHEGATDDHGTYYGPAEQFVDLCIGHFDAYDSMAHHITNEYVEFDGDDVAFSEAYFVAYMRRRADERSILETLIGRYVDRFERRDGSWRIAHRVVVYESGDSREISTPFPPNPGAFEQGRRFDSDVACTHSFRQAAG